MSGIECINLLAFIQFIIAFDFGLYYRKCSGVCAKTLDAILNYWFFVYLWKETKQYIYKLHSRRKQKIKFK